MSLLILKTHIHAPAQRCFDLSRSTDLHTISTRHTGEKAIAGVTEGLMALNDQVTWRAKHFGIRQTLTSKITTYTPFSSFTDEMVSGAFTCFTHHHYFKEEQGITLMTDEFIYESPGGVAGKLFNYLILDRYMYKLLAKRNATIKHYAETELWKTILPVT